VKIMWFRLGRREPVCFAFGPRRAQPDVLRHPSGRILRHPQNILISSSKGPHFRTLESC
jgi:hypothetical protein